MLQQATTTDKIATVTLKSTGLVYTVFPVSSRTSDTTYAVWTINNKPVHCTCKARKFNSHKMCPHMKQWLSENSQAVEAPVCSELKTSFSSIEEEYEYKLGAYGKKVAYGWLYEQKAHTTVEVVANGKAEQVAAVAEVEAEAKMDAFKRGMDEQYASDPRRGLSQGEMEAARSNMVHLYDEY